MYCSVQVQILQHFALYILYYFRSCVDQVLRGANFLVLACESGELSLTTDHERSAKLALEAPADQHCASCDTALVDELERLFLFPGLKYALDLSLLFFDCLPAMRRVAFVRENPVSFLDCFRCVLSMVRVRNKRCPPDVSQLPSQLAELGKK